MATRAGVAYIDFEGQFGKLHKQVSEAASQSERAFKPVGRNIASSMGRGVGSAVREIGRTVQTGAAVAVGATVALGGAAVKAAGDVTQLARETSAFSRASGLSTKESQAWVVTAQQRGIEVKQLQMGMATLGRNLTAVGKDGETSSKALKALGIEQKTLIAMPMAERMASISDAFSKMADGPEKAAAAQQLLGRSGQALLPILNEGGDAMREQLKLASDLVPPLGKSGKAALELAKHQRTLKMAFQGMKITVGSAVVPVLANLAEKAIPVVTRGAKLLRDRIEKLTPVLEKVGRAIDLKQIGKLADRFSDLGPAVAAVGTAFGAKLGGSLPIIGKFLGGINPVVGAIGALISTSPQLRSQFGDLLQGVFGAIQPLIGPALRLFQDLAQQALPILGRAIGVIVDAAGPLLRVLIDVAANVLTGLRPAFAAIGQAIEALRPALTTIGKVLAQVAPMLGEILVKAVNALAPLLPPIAAAFSAVVDAAAPLIPPLVELTKRVIDALMPAFQKLAPLFAEVVQAAAPLLKLLAELAAKILPPLIDIVVGAIGVFADFVGGILDAPRVIGRAIGDIVEWFSGLPDKIWGAIKGVGEFFARLGREWYRAMEEKVGEIVDFVKGLPGKIWRAIKDAAEFLGRIARAWDRAMRGTVGDILDFIGGLPGKVWAGIRSIGEFFARLGDQWLSKVREKADDVLTFVRGLPDKIWEGIKKIGDFGGRVMDKVRDGFKTGINWVIRNILNKIPFVNISPIAVGGKIDRDGVGYQAGGRVTRPTFLVGEQAPRYPEYVLATNPAYRRRNVELWRQAGADLGVEGRGFGGFLKKAANVVTAPAKAISGVAKKAWGAVKSFNPVKVFNDIVSRLTSAIPKWITDFPKWFAEKGVDWLVDQVNPFGGQRGGRVTRRGIIPGAAGPGPRDTVPAMLEPGELVIPKGVNLADEAGRAGADAMQALQDEFAKGYTDAGAQTTRFVADYGKELDAATRGTKTKIAAIRRETVDGFTRTATDTTRQAARLTQSVGTAYRGMSAEVGRFSEQIRRGTTADFAGMAQRTVAVATQQHKQVAGQFAGMQQQATGSTGRLRARAVEDFRQAQRGATEHADRMRVSTTRAAAATRDGVTRSAHAMRSGVVSDFTGMQRGASQQADRMRANATRQADSTRTRMARASQGTRTDVTGNFDALGRGVNSGLGRIEGSLNKALSALGVKKVTFNAQKKQAGGRIVGGQGSGDKVPALLEPGEVVLNREAVKHLGGPREADEINKRWPRFQAGGGVGVLRSYPRLSGDTDFLPALGIALSKLAQAVGRPISVTSGYRSIAEQTALWNRSDKSGRMVAAPGRSRHGFGDAADISPQRPAYGGRERQFGLHFPMSWEPWHIELIKGAGGAGGMESVVDELEKVALSGPAGALKDLGQAAIDKAHDAAQEYLDSQSMAIDSAGMIGDVSAAPGTLSPAQFSGLARQALELTGKFPVTAGNVAALLSRARQESGLNPRAINNWDINAKRGDPSRGLMQTIGSTFSAYHQPGTSRNIYDPLANIAAAINYMSSRYGYVVGATGKGYQRGGIVRALFAAGGITPKANAAAIKKLNAQIQQAKARAAQRAKQLAEQRKAQALTKQIKKIQDLGVLPKRLRLDVSGQTIWAEIYSDWAERAGALDEDPSEEGLDELSPEAAQAELTRRYQASLGRVFGGTQRQWLEKRLGELFKLRNSLLRSREILADALRQIARQLEQQRKKVQQINAKIEEAERRKRQAEDDIDRLNRQLKAWRQHPQANKQRIAQGERQRQTLQDRIKDLAQNQQQRRAEKAQITGKLIPALQERQKASSDKRGEVTDRIKDVQGLRSSMTRLKKLPALGALGGQIFAVQMQLRGLVPPKWSGQAPTPGDATAADASAGDTGEQAERGRLLEQLLREANQRTAIAERQFEVLRDFPPYLGSFQSGLPRVPGPAGQPWLATVHGGETITPAGKTEPVIVQIIVQDAAVDTSRIQAIARGEAQVVVRRQARAGGRVLPGAGGGVRR